MKLIFLEFDYIVGRDRFRYRNVEICPNSLWIIASNVNILTSKINKWTFVQIVIHKKIVKMKSLESFWFINQRDVPWWTCRERFAYRTIGYLLTQKTWFNDFPPKSTLVILRTIFDEHSTKLSKCWGVYIKVNNVSSLQMNRNWSRPDILIKYSRFYLNETFFVFNYVISIIPCPWQLLLYQTFVHGEYF